jgi:hypothetical protein
MKYTALISALFAGSAAAFAPAQKSVQSVTILNAERSTSMPFMNRPALVSNGVFQKRCSFLSVLRHRLFSKKLVKISVLT